MVCAGDGIVEAHLLEGVAETYAGKVIGYIEELAFNLGIEAKPAVQVEPECVHPVGVQPHFQKDVGGLVAVIAQTQPELVRLLLLKVEDKPVAVAVRLEVV